MNSQEFEQILKEKNLEFTKMINAKKKEYLIPTQDGMYMKANFKITGEFEEISHYIQSYDKAVNSCIINSLSEKPSYSQIVKVTGNKLAN